MSQEFTVKPIGFVRSARKQPIDDGWDAIETRIELDAKELAPDAALGLEAFSHVEVVYLFDRTDPAKVCRGARHPRGRNDWPLTGILAQRAKDRPNRLGVTMCRLLKVENNILSVRGWTRSTGRRCSTSSR
jgi:tRNA (adenine37-N6)-methyltransferase